MGQAGEGWEEKASEGGRGGGERKGGNNILSFEKGARARRTLGGWGRGAKALMLAGRKQPPKDERNPGKEAAARDGKRSGFLAERPTRRASSQRRAGAGGRRVLRSREGLTKGREKGGGGRASYATRGGRGPAEIGAPQDEDGEQPADPRGAR